MIVDDNERVRHMIRRLLAGSENTFYECSDGSEVVAAYKKYHPDWILMDVAMEKMDGIAATQEVTHSFPEAKVIIVTQHDDGALREKAMLAGAVDFVPKEKLVDIERIIHAQKN
jgi:CheY-like chemotaxis protein